MAAHPPTPTGWVTREVEALAAAWARGEAATARDAIARRPRLDAESAVRLIYEEVCLRREAGEDVPTGEVVALHPAWADDLRGLLACDRLIREPGGVGPVPFPGPGDTLGPFLIRDELGRGAAGRTFLASDLRLAGRPVVVKVIPVDQDEHLALARLRHTHIIPLFSEHAFPGRGLRALCMPYLGGASLAAVLDDLADVPPNRRTGRRLVRAIDRGGPPVPADGPVAGPFRRALEQASYARGAAWLIACLAEALAYAHARGLVHMDIKPSNVLLARDGQPLLLDFHLARGPMAAGDWADGRVGGTTGWMAPEQEAALDAAARGRPLPDPVDGRADIYALGMLLATMLGVDPAAPPAWAGPGLVDILRKSLAPDPDDRYQDAALLAEDLRRDLNDLPLRGVRNRSPRERWRKWRRRHPGVLAWGAVGLAAAGALLVAAGSAAVVSHHQVDRVHALLDQGRRDRAAGRFEESVQALERGLSAAQNPLVPARWGRAVRREIARAERGWLAAELHALADRLRFREAIDPPDPGDAGLLAACRSIWAERGRLLGRDGADAIRADLREVMTALVDAAASGDDARRVLAEADAALGPDPAVAARLGPPAPGEGASPAERYERARIDLRAGRYAEASEVFREARDVRPGDFWPGFFHGVCAYRLGEFADAAADFQACLALRPDSAACQFNLALALDAQGRANLARDGYARAIGLDPTLAAARLNRGLLAARLGHPADAEADFRAGLPHADPPTRARLHLALARVLSDAGDRAGARAHARQALDLGGPDAATILAELDRQP